MELLNYVLVDYFNLTSFRRIVASFQANAGIFRRQGHSDLAQSEQVRVIVGVVNVILIQ